MRHERQLRFVLVLVASLVACVAMVADPARADLGCGGRPSGGSEPRPGLVVGGAAWFTDDGTTGEISVFVLDPKTVGVWETAADCTGHPWTRSLWDATSDGRVLRPNTRRGSVAYFYGDLAGTRLNQPIGGMAVTSTGHGYWLVARDGGIFAYGDAKFYGSTGAITLNKPIVAIVPTRTNRGYWMVASDGGIFAYGDAKFYGSTGAITLNQPIIGMVATPSGHGYWMVARDGGIFSFGDARFLGSLGGQPLPAPIVGVLPNNRGGYVMVGDFGSVYNFT